MVAAVIFDLDGVLIDSEPVWEVVRRQYVADHGGQWQADSQQRLMGMSTSEWSAYLATGLGVGLSPARIAHDVVERVAQRYATDVPLMPGAVDAVHRLADRWPLGLASSSSRPLIDQVLAATGMTSLFQVTVSTEEVRRGKPAPDVYLTAVERLAVAPEQAVAVEDSSNGLRSASAAGMVVVAVPHPRYPPAADALHAASIVLRSLDDLRPEQLERLPESRSSRQPTADGRGDPT
jgi:HAD superfamily hydrolase (TIGR01509 family)